MTSNVSRKHNAEEWADQTSKIWLIEIFRILDDVASTRGKVYRTEFVKIFLKRFLSLALYRCLNERPKSIKTNEEMYQHTIKNFSTLKMDVQDGVAEAFQTCMTEYTGKTVDYYCKLSPIPPSLNKKPC